jgi:uncharacterized peroxidase-related enzyme
MPHIRTVADEDATGGDDDLVEAVKTDYRQAEVSEPTRALLDFAVLVTNDVHHVSRDAIDVLRAAGFDDTDVLDAVQIVGFFNYYNRLADALGVEPEDFMT